MKAAFAVWNGRIAPVFDVARRVIIGEIDAGREVSRSQGMFESDEIIAALCAGTLDKPDYRMPGCQRCCRTSSTAENAGRRMSTSSMPRR